MTTNPAGQLAVTSKFPPRWVNMAQQGSKTSVNRSIGAHFILSCLFIALFQNEETKNVSEISRGL